MNNLPDALSCGFMTTKEEIEDRSIVYGGHCFSKFIPKPEFIDKTEVSFKSEYAPEYEEYKSLLKAHISSDDFFIDLPKPNTSSINSASSYLTASSVSGSSSVSLSSPNALSEDYKESVEAYIAELTNQLKRLSRDSVEASEMDRDIKRFKNYLIICKQKKDVASVNNLRELHSQLLEKYA